MVRYNIKPNSTKTRHKNSRTPSPENLLRGRSHRCDERWCLEASAFQERLASAEGSRPRQARASAAPPTEGVAPEPPPNRVKVREQRSAPERAWGSPSTPITTKLKETNQTPKRACARSSPARSASSAAARASLRGASPCGPRSRCVSRSPRTIGAN